MASSEQRALLFSSVLLVAGLNARPGRATEPTAEVPAANTPRAEPTAPTETAPSKAPERKVSLEPKAVQPAPAGRMTFDIDPVADSAMIAVSLGFAGTLELINSTGEIRPQQIAPGFQRTSLFFIDRSAVAQTPDPKAGGYSTIGLGAAVAFAFVDPFLSTFREHSRQTGLADAFMYAESISFTMAMTNIVKMAVRRPRPIAYIDAEGHQKDTTTYVNSSTDSALSFFSGHSAITAAVSATATYLAFARAPHSARPWITLGVGTALTTFVSIERVRAGKHFPTDVIAGSIAGAGIGLLVPHLHRTDDIKQRRIWVGYAPMGDGARGGIFNVSGLF
jgi:membrane-associated phospholipid phosphatase